MNDLSNATIDLFRDLEPGDLVQIERNITVATVPPGYMFFSPNDYGEHLFLLQSGRVRLYKLSIEGRALTLNVLEPPEVFGEMSVIDPWLHDSFAEAMIHCTVGMLHRSDLRRAMEAHPQITLRLMELMGRRLLSMESKLSDIAFKSVPQRLATVLLSLVSPSTPASDAPIVVRYTHQQLAEMIGSYRETVTKAIGDFRSSGMIRVEEEAIYLMDMPRLRQLAGR